MTKLTIQTNYDLEELKEAYFNLYGVNCTSQADLIRFIEGIIDPVIGEILRTPDYCLPNSH